MGERAPNMNWFVIIGYYGYVNKRWEEVDDDDDDDDDGWKKIIDLESIYWHAAPSAKDVIK